MSQFVGFYKKIISVNNNHSEYMSWESSVDLTHNFLLYFNICIKYIFIHNSYISSEDKIISNYNNLQKKKMFKADNKKLEIDHSMVVVHHKLSFISCLISLLTNDNVNK